MTLKVIVACDVLKLFSVLSTIITPAKVKHIKLTFVVLYIICILGLLMNSILVLTDYTHIQWLDYWEIYGTLILSAVCVCYE
jgi:hypothetical protein